MTPPNSKPTGFTDERLAELESQIFGAVAYGLRVWEGERILHEGGRADEFVAGLSAHANRLVETSIMPLIHAALPSGADGWRVTDEMVERACAAYTSPEGTLVKCPRCEGLGYHHGFGEDGVDPDWCVNCGGSGYDMAADAEKIAMRAALEAALPAPPPPSSSEVTE